MKHVVKNFDILEKFGGTKFFGESKKVFLKNFSVFCENISI